MTLKDLFSQDISSKYKEKYPNDYNTKIIEKILKINNSDETILFVFNMTLRDWLNIFTLKKDVKDIANKYNNINIDFGKIEKCWFGIDKVLTKIIEKKSKYYLTDFIICMYNYERWFYLKKTKLN